MSRVVLAMSGGVDSSVAAWLLREAGHDVTGLFMHRGPTADPTDAQRVADRLGIPLDVLDFEPHFARIIDYFCDEYLAGRTPNPCIVCNQWLKFGKLVDYADAMGAELVATGHYARLVRQDDGSNALCRGVDASKDQAYALFGIDRRVLPRVLLPVGEHDKKTIRRIARQLNLSTADKADSQEICFVPDQDHVGFIRRQRGTLDTAGEVVTVDGAVVGRHEGIERFTVGQRRGLGIALGEPYFVVRIEPATRRVVLGRRDDLARCELTAGRANWLVDLPGDTFRAAVKIRYRSRPIDATVTLLPDARFRVIFDQPRHAVAPGQAAVCYQGERVLGGGWIE